MDAQGRIKQVRQEFASQVFDAHYAERRKNLGRLFRDMETQRSLIGSAKDEVIELKRELERESHDLLERLESEEDRELARAYFKKLVTSKLELAVDEAAIRAERCEADAAAGDLTCAQSAAQSPAQQLINDLRDWSVERLQHEGDTASGELQRLQAKGMAKLKSLAESNFSEVKELIKNLQVARDKKSNSIRQIHKAAR